MDYDRNITEQQLREMREWNIRRRADIREKREGDAVLIILLIFLIFVVVFMWVYPRMT